MDKLNGLHGERWVVLTAALVNFREQLKARAKADAKAGLDTEQHDTFDDHAAMMLAEVGWKPPEKKSKKDDKADPAQMDFTKDKNSAGSKPAPARARIKCVKCTKLFAMEAGKEKRAACPACGAIHEVNSDPETGGTFRIRERPQMPVEIHALWVKSKDPKLGKLNKAQRVLLDNWLSEHEAWIEAPELVKRGELVADPSTPGSGNPLRIDCPHYTGKECAPFDTVDTPGRSQCPKCGQPYKVEIIEGRVLVTIWSLEDAVKEQEGKEAAIAEGGEAVPAAQGAEPS